MMKSTKSKVKLLPYLLLVTFEGVIGKYKKRKSSLHLMLFTMVLGNQVAVSRNNQIDTLSSWGKHFIVEADITVNNFNGPGLVMGPSQNFHGSSISSQNFSSRVEFRAKNFRALFEPSQIRAANFSSELEQCSSQQNFLSTFCWSISFHVSKNIISSDI